MGNEVVTKDRDPPVNGRLDLVLFKCHMSGTAGGHAQGATDKHLQ